MSRTKLQQTDKLLDVIFKLKSCSEREKSEPEEPNTVKQIINAIKTGKTFEKIDYDGTSSLTLAFYLKMAGINIEVDGKYVCRLIDLMKIGEDYTLIIYQNKGFLIKSNIKKHDSVCFDWLENIFWALRSYGKRFTYDMDSNGISVLIEKETAYIRTVEDIIDDTAKTKWKNGTIDVKGFLMRIAYKEGKKSFYVFIDRNEIEDYIEYMILASLKT